MPKANAQISPKHSRRPSRQPGSGAGTRELLLSATATAIARSGWSAVTTRQVAALAGVNQGLVHYHFGSMDTLRREAVLAAMATELEGPMQPLLDDRPLADALSACLDAVAAIDMSSDRAALLYEAMLGARRDEGLRPALALAYDEFRTVLAERVRRVGGREPDAASTVITAALDGLLLHRLISPGLDLHGLSGTFVAALQAPGVASR